VWLVVLADQSFASLFGPGSAAHYLNGALLHRGTLLSDYYAVAHGSLANGVALLSGQGPNQALQADCASYTPVTPGTVGVKTGLATGQGCVFGGGVPTLADELTSAGYTWKAYVGGQGAPGCGHEHTRRRLCDPAQPIRLFLHHRRHSLLRGR
jgi:hypothetical protein